MWHISAVRNLVLEAAPTIELPSNISTSFVTESGRVISPDNLAREVSSLESEIVRQYYYIFTLVCLISDSCK